MDLQKHLENYLAAQGQTGADLLRLSGASDSAVFRVGDRILKVGPKGEATKENDLYARFAKALTKDEFSSMFPNVKVLHEQDDIVIWELTFLGSRNFAQLIMDIPLEKETLAALNQSAFQSLDLLFNKSKTSDPAQASLFFAELIKALESNLQKAGLLGDEEQQCLIHLADQENLFTSEMISSLAHKDLSLGNVMVSDSHDAVFLIDPRQAIPYLVDSTALGNVSIDLVGYLVSLERKELELQKLDSTHSLGDMKQTVLEEIEKYLRLGAFTQNLLDLCFAVWYSVYAACKCDYCTAEERVWLYDDMVSKTKLAVKKLQK